MSKQCCVIWGAGQGEKQCDNESSLTYNDWPVCRICACRLLMDEQDFPLIIDKGGD